MPAGPAGAIQYVGGTYKKFPDIRVEILDLIAEDERVVVRNRWTGTEAATGTSYEFSGIVGGTRSEDSPRYPAANKLTIR